jgi:hypothetical protein
MKQVYEKLIKDISKMTPEQKKEEWECLKRFNDVGPTVEEYLIMENSINNIINLEDFRAKDGDKISKVFIGRDRGEVVRKKSKIDSLEEKYDNINIIIPGDIYSINPSFLEEFLINVVTKLGKEKFLEKFHFISEGDYDINKSVNQAINNILNY